MIPSRQLSASEGRGGGWDAALLPPLRLCPVAILVALLLTGQALLWPLLTLPYRDQFSLSLRLLVLQRLLADQPAALAAGAWLVMTVWGGAIVVLCWIVGATTLAQQELAGCDARSDS
ncbi:MAG: hypothetical protein ACUVX9_12655 [Anaerolineae bacterium]